MRKHQQKQILEVLNTLKEAQAAELYADCQDCAISVGEFIEEVKGEGTQTVTLLEEYCELVYRASISQVGKNALNKQLTRIENSVKNELKPTRIEIAFLSYKASMSDSIESIYTAAKEDPNCDAYWIPIPYYDKNPDGTFGTMHYEGQDFYKPTIECTDYRNYNIEDHHPDAIFTFAPYDNYGHMTSVHPDFYCERLRELTDMLVYVPYFVVDDKIAEPYMKCAGVAYSHLVIVQSEEIRKKYIETYKEIEKLGYSREVYGAPEEKIVALGSPKFDAVINAKKEDYTLPASWQELIEGSDGKSKKIILFITSITPSLNNTEQYLKKLEYVLQTFSKQKDVTIWWRPHPLAYTSLSSMFPELAAKYEKIVEDYKNARWGIYDDTADAHCAIVYSDAYYGDWSSLAVLYQVTGKPIMLNDPKILDDPIPFEPTYTFATENKLWFSVRRFNALLCMDKEDWNLELVGKFPGETDYFERTEATNSSLYFRPIESNNTLIFPPFLAEEIATLSLMDNVFDKIQYKDEKASTEVKKDFIGAVADKNFIFFLPYMFNAIVRMDIKTKELSFYSDWLMPLEKVIGSMQYAYFSPPATVNRSIWLPALEGNAVVEFNMDNYESSVYEVGVKGYKYGGIVFDGESFWLSPCFNTTTPVVKWNSITGEIKTFPEIYNQNKTRGFTALKYCYGYVWLLPVTEGAAFKIDVKTDNISEVEPFSTQENNISQSVIVYTDVFGFNGKLYAFNNQRGVFIEYDCKTEKYREEVIRYSPAISNELEKLCIESLLINTEKKHILENYFQNETSLSLDGFIEFINIEQRIDFVPLNQRCKENTINVIKTTDGKNGLEIFKKVCAKENGVVFLH